MKYRRGLMIALLMLILNGCGASTGNNEVENRYTAGETKVLEPVFNEHAKGDDLIQADPLIMDLSHRQEGYFSAELTADAVVNLQITGPDGIIYKYFLEKSEEPAVFPFTAGDGVYLILAFENIGNDQYIPLSSFSAQVEIENEFLPFLYPNQYVNFSADSQAISLAGELTKEAQTDLEALGIIYDYVTEHISYDRKKAQEVESGYLPDVDETLSSGEGICFDYAALTVSMLRSLSIPARLNIGYNGDVMHAWIDVYIESQGWVQNAIEFSGNEWQIMDPTLASAIGDAELIREYTGDGESYTLLYVR